MTPIPPKTLVSTVHVKFCRAQILDHPALILDLNLTLPHNLCTHWGPTIPPEAHTRGTGPSGQKANIVIIIRTRRF